MKNRKMLINIILISIVLMLAIIPFIIGNGTEFIGTDDKAEKVISDIQSDYKPWFKPIWQPPSGQVESLLFSFQAAIGAGVIGYYIGRTSKKKEG